MATRKNPTIYLLIHRHEYGTSTALFTAEGFDPHLISENESVRLAQKCGLNFEPEKNEEVDIVDFNPKDITSVSLTDIQN